MSLEKYKQLYEYSRAILKDEFERFKNIEQKATSYLSALTLILAGAGFFVNWVLERFVPPKNCREVILIVLSILILLCVAVAWYFLFTALSMTQMRSLPLDKTLLEFFKNNNELDVYYYLAEGISGALQENRKTVDAKSKKLSTAYHLICGAVLLLILFAGLYGYQKWYYPEQKEKLMSEPNKPKQPSPQPNQQPAEPVKPASQPADAMPTPGVKPPDFPKVTHGADPLPIRDSEPPAVKMD